MVHLADEALACGPVRFRLMYLLNGKVLTPKMSYETYNIMLI